MKIKQEKKQIELIDLADGEAFRYREKTYIKTDDRFGDCKHFKIGVVNLVSGELEYLTQDCRIVPLNLQCEEVGMKGNDLLNTLIERAKENAEQVVLDELAKSMRNLYDAYRRAGFDEKEAFRLTEIHAEGVTKEMIPVPQGMIAGEKMRDHLRRIIDHYGKEAQTVKTCEELSELIYELTRMINKDEIAKDDIDRMESEMADVYVMLEQLMLMFKLERKDVMKIAWDKITRQELRIEEEKRLAPYISKEDEKTEEVKKEYVGVPLRWLPVGALFQVTRPYGTTYELTSQLRDKGQQICAVDMSDQYISRWFNKETQVYPVER